MKWRANIGLISPAQSVAETAFNQYAPRGVEIATTRIKLKASPEEPDDGFVPRMEMAADVFSALPKDIILFGCTIGSCINGYGWDEECIRRIQDRAHSPATTTITACMEAFCAIDARKIAMLTPYAPYKTKIQKEFLEAHGYQLTIAESMDVSHFHGDMDQGFLYRQVKRQDLKNADAIFISCMALHTMEIIEPLENDFHIPVITSHQASLWSVLRKSGVGDKIPGIGQLFML